MPDLDAARSLARRCLVRQRAIPRGDRHTVALLAELCLALAEAQDAADDADARRGPCGFACGFACGVPGRLDDGNDVRAN